MITSANRPKMPSVNLTHMCQTDDVLHKMYMVIRLNIIEENLVIKKMCDELNQESY